MKSCIVIVLVLVVGFSYIWYRPSMQIVKVKRENRFGFDTVLFLWYHQNRQWRNYIRIKLW